MNLRRTLCIIAVFITSIAIHSVLSEYDETTEDVDALPPKNVSSTEPSHDMLEVAELPVDLNENQKENARDLSITKGVSTKEEDLGVHPLCFLPEQLSVFSSITSPSFLISLFGTFYLSLYQAQARALDNYVALNGGLLLLFAAMSTYDLLRCYSVGYLERSIFISFPLVFLKTFSLFLYGLSVLKVNLSSHLTLPPYVSYSIAVATTVVFAGLLIRNPRKKLNTNYYVYIIAPLLSDFTIRSIRAKELHETTVMDTIQSRLEEWNKGSLRTVVNLFVGSLWAIYAIYLTPLRPFLPVSLTYIQTLWVGFTALYLVPCLFYFPHFPDSFKKIAELYFNTPSLLFVGGNVSLIKNKLNIHRRTFFWIVGSIVASLPFIGYICPRISTILTFFPSPIRNFMQTEFYYGIKLADICLTTSVTGLFVSSVVYLMGFAAIYMRIYKTTFLETSLMLYSNFSKTTSYLRSQWKDTLKRAEEPSDDHDE